MTRPLLLALAVLVGCDADDDGLSSTQEAKFGTDPQLADSDGDGLPDGAEVDDHGTDPAAWDSDGDGYPDGFELDRASDPLDDASWAYVGGWPYNAGADALEAAARSGRVAEINKTWPRMELVDQFGDKVDLYTFAQQGVPVIIDISAQWCGPCNAMAAWLDGNEDPSYETAFPNVPEAVEEGKVIWLTILGEDDAGDTPSRRVPKEWYQAYPADHIPVFADTEQLAVDYSGLTAWPTLFYLNDKLRIREEGISEVLGMINEL